MANPRAGCRHAWETYHSFDKTMPRELVKCKTCGMVLRTEMANNMRPIDCPSCGKFVVFAEEIAGFHSDADVKCPHCGKVAVGKMQCVIGIF